MGGVVLAASGCRTVDVAVDYPLASVHVVAKFEGREGERCVETPERAKCECAKVEGAERAL
jgi:hypothetical protein